MSEGRERRAVPRTALTEPPAARVRGLRGVRLRDLSLTGPQIEHLDLVRLGAPCTFDFPPPFGALSLPAEVIWCTVIGRTYPFKAHRTSWPGAAAGSPHSPGAQQAAFADSLHDLATVPQRPMA